MREIKFRGKRVDTGEWVYGDLVHEVVNAYSRIIEVGIKERGMYPVEVYPNTIGQDTGLKDKSGVDIFEGDVVKYKKYKTYVSEIKFSTKTGYRIVVDEDNIMGYKRYKNLGNSTVIKNVEVIGNIHDKE